MIEATFYASNALQLWLRDYVYKQAGVLVAGLKRLHRDWTGTYLKRERWTLRSTSRLAGGVPS